MSDRIRVHVIRYKECKNFILRYLDPVTGKYCRKTSGTTSYVQELDASGAPQNFPVTVGIANDTYTQILSGIKENDNVVTQTITSTVAKTTTGTAGITSLLGGGASRGFTGGGGAGRPGG